MIEVPQAFRDMPRWWTDGSSPVWLARLPTIVEERCARWGLVIDGPTLHGSNALVVPVRYGAQLAVLRLTPPTADLTEETAALTHWRGQGVVELLDVDIPAGACLLERLDYRRSLLHEPVVEAAATLGALARSLSIPAPVTVTSTRQIAADEAAAFEREWQDLGQPTSRRLLDASTAHAHVLGQGSEQWTSVDGDLHYEQVLAGGRRPWTVIDPTLLRGDPEYDLGRVLWTRIDELPHDRDIRAVFHAFARNADVPTDRATAWVVVRSMSYLLWGLRKGLTIDPPKCLRLLELFA